MRSVHVQSSHFFMQNSFALEAMAFMTRALIHKGGKSKKKGTFTIAWIMFGLAWSVMANILSIIPSAGALALLEVTGADREG